MSMTILDAQDAWLGGKADFQEWRQQYDATWMGPLGTMLLKMLWSRLSAPEHIALRQMSPQAHDTVQRMLFGGTDGELV